MNMRIYFPGGKKVYADYQGFTVKTDQPHSGGGENTALAPFDLFLVSLGTCAGIYVLGFCQQRGIDTTGLEIRQSLAVNPVTRLVETVDLEIVLPPGFPEKYVGAVIQSARLCTVKKHLEQPPRINISTRPSGT